MPETGCGAASQAAAGSQPASSANVEPSAGGLRARRRLRACPTSGITLIEMLVVVTIIMLFIGIVGFNLMGQAEKAKRSATVTQINSFRQQLQLYKLQVGSFP